MMALPLDESRLSKLDWFAERLAQGDTPADASLKVYGTRVHGNSMLQRLRKALGPQAV